ncbi:DUF697 domain-containing protein [Sediminicoccus sp. KRV36]|uniref:DUF697 domain-containing protein n=1 Tax=Sediminicoccus sp. KRV36 TaxID=3133721 RepID=UPI0020101737|nr:DUF697 domain-containing protein [Sediminicoccus rosea]UPY38582.1 DUF697 domain-containing protein [Sediminicoccus rosea]
MSEGPRFLDEPARPPLAVQPPPAGPGERGWVEGVQGREGPLTHAAVDALADARVPGPQGALALGALALLVLILGVAALDLAGFVARQFAVATWLGVLTLALVLGAGGVLAGAIWREWRGYAALERVDRLREGLQSQDAARARAAAEQWLLSIGEGPAAREVMAGAADAATLRALLRAGPLTRLDQDTAAAGRAAAFQVLAATVVSPWPGMDGLIVAWRGLRLVGQVARIHGMRPGTLGTLRLFRRVILDAASVAAADIAVTALTEAVFNAPLGAALAGQATGSAIAARRMLRLGFATAQVCRPV